MFLWNLFIKKTFATRHFSIMHIAFITIFLSILPKSSTPWVPQEAPYKTVVSQTSWKPQPWTARCFHATPSLSWGCTAKTQGLCCLDFLMENNLEKKERSFDGEAVLFLTDSRRKLIFSLPWKVSGPTLNWTVKTKFWTIILCSSYKNFSKLPLS